MAFPGFGINVIVAGVCCLVHCVCVYPSSAPLLQGCIEHLHIILAAHQRVGSVGFVDEVQSEHVFLGALFLCPCTLDFCSFSWCVFL
jgi:hypothetical protein